MDLFRRTLLPRRRRILRRVHQHAIRKANPVGIADMAEDSRLDRFLRRRARAVPTGPVPSEPRRRKGSGLHGFGRTPFEHNAYIRQIISEAHRFADTSTGHAPDRFVAKSSAEAGIVRRMGRRRGMRGARQFADSATDLPFTKFVAKHESSEPPRVIWPERQRRSWLQRLFLAVRLRR